MAASGSCSLALPNTTMVDWTPSSCWINSGFRQFEADADEGGVHPAGETLCRDQLEYRMRILRRD